MSRKPTVSCSVVEITPAQAQRWLDGQHHNRPLRDRIVELYLHDMKIGNWEITGQGISLDADGHLVDGQHRLTAIVRLGHPVWMVVTKGVTHNAAVRACDSGPMRTGGQRLAMQGEKNGSLKSAICRAIFVLTHPDAQYAAIIPHSEIVSTLGTFRKQIEVVEMKKTSDARIPAITRAVTAIVVSVAPELGMPFWDAISTGANLASGDPRLALRNWMNARDSGRMPVDIWAKSILTADAFLHDDKISKMMSSAKQRYARWSKDVGLDVNRSLMTAISR